MQYISILESFKSLRLLVQSFWYFSFSNEMSFVGGMKIRSIQKRNSASLFSILSPGYYQYIIRVRQALLPERFQGSQSVELGVLVISSWLDSLVSFTFHTNSRGKTEPPLYSVHKIQYHVAWSCALRCSLSCTYASLNFVWLITKTSYRNHNKDGK